MVNRADADMAAGRAVTVATPEDSQALHESAMARLRAPLLRTPEAGELSPSRQCRGRHRPHLASKRPTVRHYDLFNSGR